MFDQLTPDEETAVVAWMAGTAPLPAHLRYIAGVAYHDIPPHLRELVRATDEARCNGCGSLSVDVWCHVCRDAGRHGGIGR